MNRKFIYTICFIAISAGAAAAQTPTPERVIITTGNPTALPVNRTADSVLTPLDAATLVVKADEQTTNYRETFKNLLGRETKTFETYDKKGKLKKQSVVESNLIIYQSPKDEKQVGEYRNVVKVDGKTVGDSDKRAASLFENITKSATAQNELNDIQKESSRYDKTLEISGLTLLQSPILAEHARPFFDFTLVGRETLDGAEVFAIEYRQTKPSPYILINEKKTDATKSSLNFDLDFPEEFDKTNLFLRGKLWIDAQTFQIRRERRELTTQIENASAPLVLLESDFEYQPSEVGILAPKQITFTLYDLKLKKEQVSTVLDTKIIFRYDRFTKSDVEVKSGEVKN